MEKERMENTIVDGVCSNENKDNEGKKKPRETLYNLGIGNSTGYGFGSIKIYD